MKTEERDLSLTIQKWSYNCNCTLTYSNCPKMITQ